MSEITLTEPARKLQERISAKNATIGVVGLGYVGLPLAEVFGRAGVRVVGFDVDPKKIEAIARKESYIGDVTSEELAAIVDAGKFTASTDFDGLSEVDAILICVPTPLRKTLDPDISYIVAATEEIKSRLRPGQIVVLESTTYPGTTEEAILPVLAESGLVVGRDFFLAFSPERVDPSNPKFKTENTPKVVGGVTPECTKMACELYRHAIPAVHPVSTASTAEMVKLLENTFRLINIGLVNEVALICQKLKLDVWEIINAAATKPFGFMPFYPGPGLGGHCIPIDPHYLSWKLRSMNYFTRFIDLASEINRSMPHHVVARLGELLNNREKPIKNSRIMVVGVTYKRDCADTRESPALDVMLLLKQRGARLSFSDPYVERYEIEGEPVTRVPLDSETLAAHDAVVILTDHTGLDYDAVCRYAPLVYDTRDATKEMGTVAPNVIKL